MNALKVPIVSCIDLRDDFEEVVWKDGSKEFLRDLNWGALKRLLEDDVYNRLFEKWCRENDLNGML